MASFPAVEAAVRTLKLLELLNQQAVSTLAQLHAATGIPKPSILRLLQTLEGLGYVAKGGLGTYRLASRVRALASGYHSEPRIVEVIAPLLDDLTAAIKWPAALAMLDGDAMVVRYSTISSSPLSLRHSTINMRLSLATRALGLSYLAFCEVEELDALMKLIEKSIDDEDALGKDSHRLKSGLESIRRKGYAVRNPQVRPISNTLAMPVFESRRLVATIGITWFASVLDEQEAVERYLAPLMNVASEARLALSTGN